MESTDEVKGKIQKQKRDRQQDNIAKSNADLARDLESLTAKLNTERFCFAITIACILDAVIFTYYNNWAAPICLTLLEAAGFFVLARYLEVGEVATLIVEIIKNLGKKESDPPKE